jgi:hypothetical protein
MIFYSTPNAVFSSNTRLEMLAPIPQRTPRFMTPRALFPEVPSNIRVIKPECEFIYIPTEVFLAGVIGRLHAIRALELQIRFRCYSLLPRCGNIHLGHG